MDLPSCQLVAPGNDELSDVIDEPPRDCAERPSGFTYSIGLFNYGNAQLTLSWTKVGCTVNDTWSLVRQ